jgi:hypothetical protein
LIHDRGHLRHGGTHVVPVTQFTGMKFLALAAIGTIFFVIALARFRTTIGTMP